MNKLKWTEWLLVGVLALATALVVVLAGAVGLQTYREHQALLNIVGYNLQQGKLVTVPQAPPAAALPAAAKPPDPAKPTP